VVYTTLPSPDQASREPPRPEATVSQAAQADGSAPAPAPNQFRHVPTFLPGPERAGPLLASREHERPEAPVGPMEDGPPPQCFYGRADYLLWWVKGSPLPPLGKTQSIDPITFVPGTPGVSPGALPLAGTAVVLGNDRVSGTARSGGRFQVGEWLLDDRLLGIEAGAFFLGRLTDRAALTSLGTDLLARPVRDAGDSWKEVSLVRVLPPNQLGTLGYVNASSLWGAEANLRTSLVYNPGLFIDLLAGYRTVGLNESLTINDLSVQAGTPAVVGGFGTLPTTIDATDRFGVSNQFHGGQVGAEAGLLLGPLSLEARARLALGYTAQTLNIAGSTFVTGPGVEAAVPFGVLATAGNGGQHHRSAFSVVPELGLTVGYQVTDWMKAYVGYDLLYWSSVLRPGNQVDRTVNVAAVPTQLNPVPGPGSPAAPGVTFHATDFWAQGIHLGLEFRY
jgi:hypothetical protein